MLSYVENIKTQVLDSANTSKVMSDYFLDALSAEDDDKHWVYLQNLSFFKDVAFATEKIKFIQE